MTDKIRDMFDIAWEQKYQNPSHAIFDKHDFFLMYQAGYQAANAEARELVKELAEIVSCVHTINKITDSNDGYTATNLYTQIKQALTKATKWLEEGK